MKVLTCYFFCYLLYTLLSYVFYGYRAMAPLLDDELLDALLNEKFEDLFTNEIGGIIGDASATWTLLIINEGAGKSTNHLVALPFPTGISTLPLSTKNFM